MISKPRLLWTIIALFGLFLTGCNLPTPTEAPASEVPADSLVEPEPASSEVPTSAPATVATTSEAEGVPTASVAQVLRVAYTDDGNLWVVEKGLGPVQLTDSGGIIDVRLSDDGEWIAYVVRDPDQDTVDLHSVRFDGNVHLVLLEADGFDALYPPDSFFIHTTLSSMDFLPGSHTLLINTRGVFDGPGLAKNDDLMSINAETGQFTSLLPRGEGGDFTASPNGDKIALARHDSLSIVDANGANLRSEVLTYSSVMTYSEYLFYPLPVWSDNSVVLPVPQQDPFFAAEPGTVWSVDGEAQVIAEPTGDLFAPQRQLPIVSPDGMHLAYFRELDEPGEQQLVIERLDNGEQVVYDTGSLHSETFQWKGWGPDSYLFAYTKGSGLDLYLGDLLGEPEPLGSGTGLRWVNAGEYLYLMGVPGSWTLTLADIEGNRTPLAIISNGDYYGWHQFFDFAE